MLMQIPMQEKNAGSFTKKKSGDFILIRQFLRFLIFMQSNSFAFCKKNNIRVPEDISIVGFDDSLGSKYSLPALTTVRQDAQARAQAAIQLLPENEIRNRGAHCS